MTNTKKGISLLTIGALGVVFGDIGTSPLYAMKVIFGSSSYSLPINELNVLGILSIIIWSITIIVSVKYIYFLMRANNDGEGGIIALIALINNKSGKYKLMPFFIFLGLVGVALFYGDSVITPAISVLSAVEGLNVVTPSLSHLIVPITIMLLTLLFWIQKYGTGLIGKLFGPIMLVWFISIGLAGANTVIQNPNILVALSPFSAFNFITHEPLVAFLAMSAVTLAITGAEALYADMGHFGRKPISRAWFLIVFPALALCYMGQGALLLNNPASINNPLVLLFPEVLRFSFIILATFATLIASQSVISGAFSLTQQAVHLNFLPKMLIKHTSNREAGQVYLPFVNYSLYVAVLLLVIVFGSSAGLANAFGMAVSATLAIDTILFAIVARLLWKKSIIYVASALLVFLSLDLILVTSNVSKILKGAWIPLLIAFAILLLITTWIKGSRIIKKEREQIEGPLQEYIDDIRHAKPPIPRINGLAVYISHHKGLAPMALRATIEKLHELHKQVIIVTVEITNYPHVLYGERIKFDELKYKDDGICQVNLKYGYHDTINVPKTLSTLPEYSPELDFDKDEASYFVSLSRVVPTNNHRMAKWRKYLYTFMAKNATSSVDYYKLPIDQTVEMRSLIKL